MQRTWLAAGLDYPEQVAQLAKKVSSFTLISTPAFLKRNFIAPSDLDNCKAVFSSGGLLSFEAAELTKSVFNVAPIEVYGSTESGGVAYRQRTQEHQTWKTFSVVQVSKNDRDQLVVKSPYFDEASLSMGDRVEFTADGFELLGRIDDVVKVEEKRVSLSEMNSKIISSGFIKEAATIALEENGRQQLACVAILNSTGEKVLQEKGLRGLTTDIRDSLKPYFEAVVIPKKFRFVDRLPYNEQSKLVKSELIGYFHEHG
ncbi:D-alanine--poly(phosphoribitol) ligase subunit 1 [compost metagenome]